MKNPYGGIQSSISSKDCFKCFLLDCRITSDEMETLMKILVDGMDNLVTMDKDQDGTLEDFFMDFKKFVSENQRIVSNIKIDGNELTPPFVDDLFATELKDVEELSITTEPVVNVKKETLKEVDAHIEESINDFKKASEIVYDQKYVEVNELISNAVTRWRYVQRAIDLVVNLMVINERDIDTAAIKKMYQEFAEIIEQIAESMHNKDYMMIKDIIDYELLDKLEEFKNIKDELASKL